MGFRGRKWRGGGAHNVFIPHYLASIQYSEHDLGKRAWYADLLEWAAQNTETRAIVIQVIFNASEKPFYY